MKDDAIDARNRMIRRYMHMDADDDEEGESTPKAPKGGSHGGGGNTRLPYGLCEEFGINTEGFSPKDCWDALKGKGVSPKAAFASLQKNGTIGPYVQELRDKGVTGGSGSNGSEGGNSGNGGNGGSEGSGSPYDGLDMKWHKLHGMLTKKQCRTMCEKLKDLMNEGSINNASFSMSLDLNDSEKPYAPQIRLSNMINFLKNEGVTEERIAGALGKRGKRIIQYYTPPLKMESWRPLVNEIKHKKPPLTIKEMESNPLVKEMDARIKAKQEERERKGKGGLENDPSRRPMEKDIAAKLANVPPLMWNKDKRKWTATGTVQKNFIATVVIGPPAAGKSSSCVNYISEQYGARVIDSDEAKPYIPEFNGGEGADDTHEESSKITKYDMIGYKTWKDEHNNLHVDYNDEAEFGQHGKHNGENLVIPTIGDNYDKLRAMISALQHAGYKINLVLNEAEPETYIGRSLCRTPETKREIGTEYLNSIGTKPSAVYEMFRNESEGIVSSFVRINSNGKSPKVMEAKNADGSDIPEDKRWFDKIGAHR